MSGKHLPFVVVLTLWASLMPATAPGDVRVIYVDANASGLDDGTSWSNAFHYLHDGLSDAYFGSKPAEVRVAAGVYRPDRGVGRKLGDPNRPFILITGVTVKGGYAGSGQPDPNQRNINTYRTVLSGDLADNDDPTVKPRDLLGSPTRADNSHCVIYAGNVDETAVLDGFTIMGGNDATENGQGGGLYCREASPRVLDCSFIRNAARSYGGGLLINSGNVTLVNCVLRDNAAQMGGGVFSYKASPNFQDCTFQGGYADEHGAGLATLDAGEPNLFRCTFLENDANYAGGGIGFCKSGGSVRDCLFRQNRADFAGAVFNDSTSAVFTNCRFEDNSATGSGGAVYNMTSTAAKPAFHECRFEANSATYGGAVYNDDVAVTATSCVFARNHSDRGGGAIYNDERGGLLSGCTFVSNTAGSYPGQTAFLDKTIKYDLDPPLAYVFKGYGPDGGALYNYDCSPTIVNCLFNLNCAQNLGGALFNYAADQQMAIWNGPTIWVPGHAAPILKNCTFLSNIAAWGGEMWNSAMDAEPELTNGIVWSNLELRSRRTPHAWFHGTEASYSDIEGGWQGQGNINQEPLLTPSGHLRAGSSVIDRGDPNFTVDPDYPTDLDGEARVAGSAVDLGADEFADRDKDGLPDWWETRYLGEAFAGDPDRGPEEDWNGDGYRHIDEYELLGTNPTGKLLHVDASASGSAGEGTAERPFATLQQALDAAANGDTIRLQPGVYAGPGNYNLDLHHKSLILQSAGPEAEVILDCNGLGRFIDPLSGAGSNLMLDGLTIKGGASATGSTVQMESGRFILKDCRIQGDPAARGGLFSCGFSNLTVAGLDLRGPRDLVAEPNGGSFSFANIFMDDSLNLGGGCYDVISTRFDGPGSIVLDPNTRLKIKNQYAASESTYFRTDVKGPGRIEIEPGQQLTIEGKATINLSATGRGLPDPKRDGHIVVEGSLFVRGNATLECTNVDVRILDVNDPNTIQYNNITLLEASTGFGGEFFVSGTPRISQNSIFSEGDRYLDLDPDPNAADHPTITNNRIGVLVKEGKLASQGALLELRAKDYDAGTASNPTGGSGAYPVTDASPGFTQDPSANWVLERLVLEPNAKLNLTNRQGFRFQPRHERYPEAVYVKELVMGPNAVLNTAFQTLYYQRLVDPDGTTLVRNPADPEAPLLNGARFRDVPLLGFSLGIIAMNDQMEFEVRVAKRLRPLGSQSPDIAGVVQRIAAPVGIPAGYGGVMEMDMQAPGKAATSSVAAKGAFARAGKEEITVEFEYLFLDDPDGKAELIVYLSDDPDVSERLREVARVRPPQPGRPGAIGSGRFGLFTGAFPRGDLNFVRGTHVELELHGRGARCWIDNWDPRIYCSTCGDYDGQGMVNIIDYYLLLQYFGLTRPGSNENAKACLDLVADGCISVHDLLAWETQGKSVCPWGNQRMYVSETTTEVRAASGDVAENPEVAAVGPLAILGKADASYGASQVVPNTVLYSFDPNDSSVQVTPLSGTGRLVMDSRGQVCRVDPAGGIFQIDGTPVATKWGQDYQGKYVTLGRREMEGVFLADAAFHPTDPCLVYVVPVLVRPLQGAGSSYAAAARLRLTGHGEYTIDALYGSDPNTISAHKAKDPDGAKNFLNEPDLQHLQEIELDPSGQNLFVLSSCWYNQNNWVLFYDAEGPGSEGVPVWLNDPAQGAADLVGPGSMVVSATGDKLYLVSSGQDVSDTNDLAKRVYCYGVAKAGPRATGLLFDHVITVQCPPPAESLYQRFGALCDGHRSVASLTSLAEDPADGTLYAVGFTAPRLGKDARWPAPETRFCATPILARIRPSDRSAPASELTGCELALPLSVIWRR